MVLAVAFGVAALDGALRGQAAESKAPPPVGAFERQSAERLLDYPIGPDQTIRSLHLPEEFVRRVVDRMIRMEYRRRFYQIADDTALPESSESVDGGSAAEAAPSVSSERRNVARAAGDGQVDSSGRTASGSDRQGANGPSTGSGSWKNGLFFAGGLALVAVAAAVAIVLRRRGDRSAPRRRAGRGGK